MNYDETLKQLRTKFGPDRFMSSTFRDNRRIQVPAEILLEVLRFLKDKCGCDMLVELGGADYLHYPNATDRYGVWYVLLNTGTGERLIVKSFANDPDPQLPSCFSLWRGADWMEREVYDMYGVVFDGHPDMRRVLLPDEFSAFPLRKDYPQRGRGERHNFPVITRAQS